MSIEIFAKDDDDEDEIVSEFVVLPHLYIAADTDPVDCVVGMVDVVPSPTPPGSNDDVVDQFVDQSLDESHLASGTTAVCHQVDFTLFAHIAWILSFSF